MIKKNNFSYVEFTVLAVVLVVTGRTLAPRFTKASSDEEKISVLTDGLEVMRAQMDLYRVQHGGVLPPSDSFTSFEKAMTTKVDKYGPYVEKIPTNPFNGLKTVRFDGEPAGADKAGWRLDTETGLFKADNDTACSAL